MKNSSAKSRVDSVDHLVGKRLRKRRIMMGLSQGDLGEAVKVSIQQIQKYEKAVNRISSGKLHSFAKLLRVPVSYFFENEEETASQEISGYTMAEESANFAPEENATEREVVLLIKYFNSIATTELRKKLIDIAKTLACSEA